MRKFFVLFLLLFSSLGPAPAQALDPFTACTFWDECREQVPEGVRHTLQIARDIILAQPNSWAAISRQGRDCMRGLQQCSQGYLNNLLRAHVRPVFDRYEAYLNDQVRAGSPTSWRRLSAAERRFFAPFYPEIRLNQIRYAQNIDTIHGAAITIGNNIYFPRGIDRRCDGSDLRWLLHEIEHAVQYGRRGGKDPFLTEYLAKAAGNVARSGTFDVHDFIDLERAADAKAQNLLPAAYEFMSNLAATVARPCQ